MSDCREILISLAPAYTKAILEGKKTVELRRRRLNVSSGTRVWLYSKAPTARVEGTARIQRIHEAEPKGLWSRYSDVVGISRAEFDEYFRGCSQGCAIVLGGAQPLVPALDLQTMRKRVVGFHPPQFFKRLDGEELKILLQTSHARSAEKHAITHPRTRLPKSRGAELYERQQRESLTEGQAAVY